jgi:hypothetical protein
MKRTIIGSITLCALMLSLAAVASAQDFGPCPAAILTGQWGYTETGTLYPAGVPPIPFASVGKAIFDAEGNASGIQTTSKGGQILLNESIQGNITMNPNCTGQMTVGVYDSGKLTRTGYVDFAIDDNAMEIRAIVSKVVLANGASVPLAATIDFRRLLARSCATVTALAGQAGYVDTGVVITPSGPVAFAAAGKVVGEADGSWTATQTGGTAGNIAKNLLKGTTTLNSDCTATITLSVYDESGTTLLRTATFFAVFDDNASEEREIATSLVLVNSDGTRVPVPAVITGNAKKLFTWPSFFPWDRE